MSYLLEERIREVKELMNTLEEKSLKELRPMVIAQAKKLEAKSGVHIDIDDKDIKIVYGQTSNEC